MKRVIVARARAAPPAAPTAGPLASGAYCSPSRSARAARRLWVGRSCRARRRLRAEDPATTRARASPASRRAVVSTPSSPSCADDGRPPALIVAAGSLDRRPRRASPATQLVTSLERRRGRDRAALTAAPPLPVRWLERRGEARASASPACRAVTVGARLGSLAGSSVALGRSSRRVRATLPTANAGQRARAAPRSSSRRVPGVPDRRSAGATGRGGARRLGRLVARDRPRPPRRDRRARHRRLSAASHG